MRTELPDATALVTADSARTTFSESEYCRKLAAVKKNSKLSELGLPKTFTNCSSDDISVMEETGPFWKGPQIAPIEVATAGTTFVKSTSFT